jgi:hypothetical protein
MQINRLEGDLGKVLLKRIPLHSKGLTGSGGRGYFSCISDFAYGKAGQNV